MLAELHVKNFALIEQADLCFREGLNVLSGETGAGKSILIDAISAALGEKTGKDVIRTGTDSAYIELLFQVDESAHRQRLSDLGFPPEADGTLMVSRKLMKNRSVLRINGEAVTAGALREATAFLLDIHGQHDHQSLFHPESHLSFVDMMAPEELKGLKEACRKSYERYTEIRALLKKEGDKAIREREKEILAYEIQEIKEAELREGEEEELESDFRRMQNASRIREALEEAAEYLSTDAVSRAVRALNSVSALDKGIPALVAQTEELDSLLSDAGRSVSDLLSELDTEPGELERIGQRLDLIRHLEERYADSVPEILRVLSEKEARLSFLEEFDERQEALLKERDGLKEKLTELSEALHGIRIKTAGELEKWVKEQLSGLNFSAPAFEVRFTERDGFGPDGTDSAEFYLSTNPGEPMKPLRNVASGGELSRIMLALKTVFSEQDRLETMIFDEIDTGISGRTAQMAAEKLAALGRRRQVLCITHLPQIAAMADHHYLIEKAEEGGRTRTSVREMNDSEITGELARLIGGTEITEGVLRTAEEMKALAGKAKKKLEAGEESL